MDYIELSITVDPVEQGSDVLIAQLAEIGFESFVQNSDGFKAYVQKANFNENELKQLLSEFDSVFKIQKQINTIEQQNWNAQWESSFEPINVKNECIIRAPFHEKQEGIKYDIIIEPKMSFGTGHHFTTQLMIEKLMMLNIVNKSLLDMGCGTGVLAILASFMGANVITAIDIDEWSYLNTIENAERNNVKNVLVYKGNAQILEKKTFNTILANINKNVLLADIEIYANSIEKNGDLVMSGFFETDANDIIYKANKLGFELKDKMVNNQWTLLHFKN